MESLKEVIGEEIRDGGSISFERFMDVALYHPALGYYSKGGESPRTGRAGDFFTSVSVGPLFGRLLGLQFLEMWTQLGCPDAFWIVEQGSEDAQLACDILAWCRHQAPHFLASIRYGLIEPQQEKRVSQEKKLAAAGEQQRAKWFLSLEKAAKAPICGVFFSNELVDAFPVRVLARRKDDWLERRVGLDDQGSFVWIEKAIKDQELTTAISSLPLPEVEDYVTEINLRAPAWLKSASRLVQKGYLLTIDYGFTSSYYYAPFRCNGTLTAYCQHQQMTDVLRNPGAQDLTAHVDFTALARAGNEAGLTTVGFLDQQHFLMGIAHEELGGIAQARAGIADHLRAWNTLTHPSYLGARFQVLLQAKDAPDRLSGLRYARPGDLQALK